MAKKKKKRSRAKKTRRKNFPLISFLALCMVVFLGFLYLFVYSKEAVFCPEYEEIYSRGSHLHRAMGKIDHAIFDALYRKGIREKDIVFLSVRPRHSRGYDWDLTEMEVRLTGKSSLSRLSRVISGVLTKLEPNVSLEKRKVSEGEFRYLIFALGFCTHKIKLVCETRERLPEKHVFKVAIIVDDLGYDADIGRAFMALDLPLSLAFLPLAPRTGVMLRQVNRRRHELMLHEPMEPAHWPDLDPGPGALMAHMGKAEIEAAIGRHLKMVPGAVGVNNHMGSYFTQRRDKMRIVLNELKRRHLFFVDSRTTSKTVGFELARQMGVPTVERSVFLDNEPSSKAVQFQMERLLGMARHSGAAVGICHPNRWALNALKQYLPRLNSEFEVVAVSELVN